ncbi:hypothetical protein GCM10010844_36620 [Deinococcus radiotolerans]|uniref:DUF305 domain-containing protein n=1 Tax=Deinococcus radiotolerans TaxID=1309407 RepID=A0ABQ2FPK8_9DEIO|nr:hypothetical protein GCM10010844_36620 [Deinococcus radiotolerans]
MLGVAALGGAATAATFLLSTPRPPTQGSADVRFLRDMRAHHAQAVEMSVTLLKRAEDADVRLLAQDITLTQQAQIGQMSGWLTAWGHPVAGAQPPMQGMNRAAMGLASARDVRALENRPITVATRQYLLLMRAHHLGGVAMARAALKEARHPLVVTFARTVVTSQAAEVRAIDALLTARKITPPPTPVPTDMEDMDHG